MRSDDRLPSPPLPPSWRSSRSGRQFGKFSFPTAEKYVSACFSWKLAPVTAHVAVIAESARKTICLWCQPTHLRCRFPAASGLAGRAAVPAPSWAAGLSGKFPQPHNLQGQAWCARGLTPYWRESSKSSPSAFCGSKSSSPCEWVHGITLFVGRMAQLGEQGIPAVSMLAGTSGGPCSPEACRVEQR